MSVLLFLLGCVVLATCENELTYDFDKISQLIADTPSCKFSGPEEAWPLKGGCGCDYPNEFCFWFKSKLGDKEVPEELCDPLSDECKKALAEADPEPESLGGDAGGAAGTDGGPGGPGTGGGPGGPDAGGARDWHEFCCFWANEGECQKNPIFMGPVCQKSCGTLGCRAEVAASCPVTVNTAGCRWTQVTPSPSG